MVRAISERFVNNFMTIMIARVAMIVTPLMIAAFGYGAAQMWESIDSRLTAVEESEIEHSSQLQDHESRLKFAAVQADQFAEQIERRFNELGGSLKELNAQIIGINGAIIRLQTTIENRLPPRTAKADPQPQTGGVVPVPSSSAAQ